MTWRQVYFEIRLKSHRGWNIYQNTLELIKSYMYSAGLLCDIIKEVYGTWVMIEAYVHRII